MSTTVVWTAAGEHAMGYHGGAATPRTCRPHPESVPQIALSLPVYQKSCQDVRIGPALKNPDLSRVYRRRFLSGNGRFFGLRFSSSLGSRIPKTSRVIGEFEEQAIPGKSTKKQSWRSWRQSRRIISPTVSRYRRHHRHHRLHRRHRRHRRHRCRRPRRR